MDPIIGALLASGLSAIFGSAQTIFANKYNSPVSQLRRLRKAGLPLSYMYQGRVNQQSDVPKLSIDPTLGVTQKIQLEQQKPVQEAQVSNLQAETAGKKLANIEEEKQQAWRDKEITVAIDNKGRKMTGTNREVMLSLERERKNADRFIANNEGGLREIALDIASYLKETNKAIKEQELVKIKQQIANLMSQDKLLSQLHDIRSIEAAVNETIGGALEGAPAWMKAIYWTLIKLFDKQ